MTVDGEEFVCPWCGQDGRMVFVKGHYECNACHKPVVDCCDGERTEEASEKQ